MNCKIPGEALSGTDFSKIVIADGITTIPEYAFMSCGELKSVIIPESVTTIEDSAFYSCASLTSVTLPSSLKTIGFGVFYYCWNMTSLYCKAKTPPTANYTIFSNMGEDFTIYVPSASVSKYKSAAKWKDFTIVGYNF